MYFAPQLINKVVAQYLRCLLDGGWLFVSSCETSNPIFSGFEATNFPDAILYQKVNPGGVAKPKSNIFIQSSPPLIPPPPVQAATAPSSLWHEVSHKDDTEALTLQCRKYANEGKLAEALRVSELVLAADKLSSGLHYLRAVILQEQGMYDEASMSFKKALYLDQDLVMAHFTLANLEQRKGKVKESRRHFNAALTILGSYSPDDVIPESDGMFAWKLAEIIRTTTASMSRRLEG
jgi:chemotaxis protein methyltransferase CheR